MSIYYAESLETIGDNLKEISPDGFSTVPRLLEKMFEKDSVTPSKSIAKQSAAKAYVTANGKKLFTFKSIDKCSSAYFLINSFLGNTILLL